MPYQLPGRYFVHEEGRGRDSAFLIDQTDLTTASGLFADGFELVNIDHVPHADAVMDSPTDYLWSTIQNTAVLKPLVVWSISSPTRIDPAATIAFNWTVTGTLPPDFSQPTTTMMTLSRHLYQAEVGEIQSEFIPNGFLLVAASGVAASGSNITFHPNEIPGYYDFAIAQHTDLWRQAPLRVVASGTTPSLNPVISGAGQVSGWTLGTSGSDWTIYRRARRAESSNVNDLSVDYEYGAVFLQNSGAISVLDNAGVETTVDLIANDGSLDMIIYGDDTSINITASGTNSDINLTASGSTSDINLLARGDVSTINAIAEGMSSQVVLVANGFNSLIDMEANGENAAITMAANGDGTSISEIASGDDSRIDLLATGDGAVIGVSAIEPGSSLTTNNTRGITLTHLGPSSTSTLNSSNEIDISAIGDDGVSVANPFNSGNTSESGNKGVRFLIADGSTSALTNSKGFHVVQTEGYNLSWNNQRGITLRSGRSNGGLMNLEAYGTGSEVEISVSGNNSAVWLNTQSPDSSIHIDALDVRSRIWLDAVAPDTLIWNTATGPRAVINLEAVGANSKIGLHARPGTQGIIVSGTKVAFEEASGQVTMSGMGRGFILPHRTDGEKASIAGPGAGNLIWNSSSGTLNVFDGASWRAVAYSGATTGGAGVTDHGDLTGLSDDDHTQYLLVDGTRAVTGDFRVDKSTDATLNINLDSGSTASQQIDLHFCDRGTQQFALRKNTSNNFVFRDHINSKSSVVIELGANDNTLVVDSNSRVGIGTASPSQALHVVGEGYFTGNVELKNTADAGLSFIIDSGLTTTQLANFAFQDQGNGQWTIGKDTSNNFAITDLIGGVTPFTIQQSVTGDTGASIVIESTGDVGIGTGSPAYKLDVNGDIQARGGDIISDPQSGNANATVVARARGTGTPLFRMASNGQAQQWRTDVAANSWRVVDEITATAPIVVESGTPTALLYLDSSVNGRVGIRTAAPTTDLHVVGSGIMSALALGTTPSDLALINASHQKDTPIVLNRTGGGSPQYIDFQTGGFTAARIGVNASAGISMYSLFGVNEFFRAGNSLADSIVVGTSASAQVGIGDSPASGTLHVHGTGYFNSGVSVSGTPVMLNKGGVRENRVVSTINSAAEADIINFTVPGSTFSSTNSNTMDVMIGGTYSNTSGANRTLRLRIYYGATTLYNDTTGNIATSTAGDRAWNFNLRLMPMSDPANYVYGIGTFVVGAAGATTAGQGDLGTTATFVLPVVASGNPSLASNANFRVTLTNSAALPTISFRRSLAFAQII